MIIHVAEQPIIEMTLQRRRKERYYTKEVDLGDILREIMTRANEFVPSESGSIFLDDPVFKREHEEKTGRLYFLACFGDVAESLIGTYLPDDIGIVGATYRSGRAYLSEDVTADRKFYSKVDKKTKFVTKSVISMPIVIDSTIIGVIELINRKDRVNYDRKDLALLEIFAGYTSTLIQNSLDARRFEDLSKRDNLTGIFNSRYLYERLSYYIGDAIESGADLSLIFLDLDHFKKVNDIHGHLAGSRVLKEVADIMTEVFSEEGQILARYGGDEYVIMLPGKSLDAAAEHAERFRKAVEENIFLREPGSLLASPLNIDGVITCSIGVASLRCNVENRENIAEVEEALIKAADKAMYRAKDLGKNRVFAAEGKQ